MSGEQHQHEVSPPLPPRPGASGGGTTRDTRDGSDSSNHTWSKRLNDWGLKVSAPLNSLTNKLGSEAFLPTTLDKECEKAARILNSFCKEGVYKDTTDGAAKAEGGPKTKSRALLKIPPDVIARAQGLLIFTTMRTAFHWSGAGGSGVLVARLPDGSWSPPGAVFIHTLGAGLVIGVDIYDCVVVINTREALEAFTRLRLSLGSDLSVAAGPWGGGGMVDWGVTRGGKGKEKERSAEDISEKPNMSRTATPTGNPADVPAYQTYTPPPSTFDQPQPHAEEASADKNKSSSSLRNGLRNTVYSYVKSRGFYAGVAVDGTVIVQRAEDNAAFYGERHPVSDILAGRVRPQPGPTHWPAGARVLHDTIAAVEGWADTAAPGVGAYPQNQGPQPAWSAPHSYGDTGPSSSAGMTTGVEPAYQSGRYSSKAAEAEAEASANRHPSPGPPAYAEPSGSSEDRPPPYA